MSNLWTRDSISNEAHKMMSSFRCQGEWRLENSGNKFEIMIKNSANAGFFIVATSNPFDLKSMHRNSYFLNWLNLLGARDVIVSQTSNGTHRICHFKFGILFFSSFIFYDVQKSGQTCLLIIMGTHAGASTCMLSKNFLTDCNLSAGPKIKECCLCSFFFIASQHSAEHGSLFIAKHSRTLYAGLYMADMDKHIQDTIRSAGILICYGTVKTIKIDKSKTTEYSFIRLFYALVQGFFFFICCHWPIICEYNLAIYVRNFAHQRKSNFI